MRAGRRRLRAAPAGRTARASQHRRRPRRVRRDAGAAAARSGSGATRSSRRRSPPARRTPIDVRDPRNRTFGHIDAASMDPAGQTQDRLAVSASMRTALLVYSGISVKMMVDSDLGADLSTMFMVQYEPNGFAGPHDHPLEEAYLILDGEVDGSFDGETYRLRPRRRRVGRRRLRARVPQRRGGPGALARDAGAAAAGAPFLSIRPRLDLPRRRPRRRSRCVPSRKEHVDGRVPRRHQSRARCHGGRLGEPRRLRAPAPVPARAGATDARRSSTSARCCCSRPRTSATRPRRRSATGRSTRASAGRSSPARAGRASGTSARRQRRTGCSCRTCTTPRTRSAGNTGLQGAIGPETGLHAGRCARSRPRSRRTAWAASGSGVDLAETAVFLALQGGGPQHRRRPAGHDARARDQEPRRARRC